MTDEAYFNGTKKVDLTGGRAGTLRAIGRGILIALVPALCLLFYGVALSSLGMPKLGALCYFLLGVFIFGPLFCLIVPMVAGPAWLVGIAFGIILWLAEALIIFPSLGFGPFGTDLGKWSPVVTLAVWVMYGGILGASYGFVRNRHKLWRVVCAAFVLLVVGVICVRTLIFQIFYVSGASLAPTLIPRDIVWVSKYAYGYSRYSLPFSPPLFSGRIVATQPSRGDLVVYAGTRDDRQAQI
jgi:hypothetical protein